MDNVIMDNGFLLSLSAWACQRRNTPLRLAVDKLRLTILENNVHIVYYLCETSAPSCSLRFPDFNDFSLAVMERHGNKCTHYQIIHSNII